jgi:hypothetical protein
LGLWVGFTCIYTYHAWQLCQDPNHRSPHGIRSAARITEPCCPSNRNVGKCTLESDGNLVIYGQDNKTVVWQSASISRQVPCYLAVRPDGQVSIYPPQGPPIWTKPEKP